MTVSEFKAWFEGFTEAMDGPPDAKQWARIQSKVKEIADKPSVAYREPPVKRRFTITDDGFSLPDVPRNGGMAVDMVEAGRADYRATT